MVVDITKMDMNLKQVQDQDTLIQTAKEMACRAVGFTLPFTNARKQVEVDRYTFTHAYTETP